MTIYFNAVVVCEGVVQVAGDGFPLRRVATPTLTSYCRSGNTSTEVMFRVRVRDRVSVGKETCRSGDV